MGTMANYSAQEVWAPIRGTNTIICRGIRKYTCSIWLCTGSCTLDFICVFTARLKNSVPMTLPTRMSVGSSIASWFFAWGTLN